MTNIRPLGYARGGAGKTLVMQHGYLGGSALWQAQIDYFSRYYDVITPELAGHGRSAHLTAPESIAESAQLVFDLLDDLGVDDFMLVGHSMGGMIVQQMALMQASRIDKLVCFGTGPVGLLPNRFETLAESRARIQNDGLAKAAARIASTWFINGEAAPGYAVCLAAASRVSEQAALACLCAWEGWNVYERLAEISMPTLIIWGDSDKSYGWSQPQALWRGIANSRLAVMPGCAHNAHMEKPVMFNLILQDFLAEPIPAKQ